MNRVRSFAVLAIVLLVLSTATVARANHIDSMYKTANFSHNCDDNDPLYCQTDNNALRWYDEGSISFTGRTRIDSVLEGTFEPTDFAVSFQNPPVYTGGSETDVIYRRLTLPAGVLGETHCDDASSSTQCDQHYVDFSLATPDPKVICHESGHAVGLTHGDVASPRVSTGDNTLGCLQTPFEEITSATLGSHNAALINSTY